MICPGDHQQDKNSTSNNPGLFPRNMVQGHAGLERNEATEMATVFPCQHISVKCVPFIPLIAEGDPLAFNSISYNIFSL